jgi:hypothetical protein
LQSAFAGGILALVFQMPLTMKEKRKSLEDEMQQLLKESKAENDALKKLIEALHQEEMKKRTMKGISDESSQLNIK